MKKIFVIFDILAYKAPHEQTDDKDQVPPPRLSSSD